MRYQILSILVAAFLLPAVSFALSLDQAKTQGLVGETPAGYLQSVQANPSQDVKALVADINSKRKAEYEQIAKKTGSDLPSVEKLAAKKAYAKTSPGHYLLGADGKWTKK